MVFVLLLLCNRCCTEPLPAIFDARRNTSFDAKGREMKQWELNFIRQMRRRRRWQEFIWNAKKTAHSLQPFLPGNYRLFVGISPSISIINSRQKICAGSRLTTVWHRFCFAPKNLTNESPIFDQCKKLICCLLKRNIPLSLFALIAGNADFFLLACMYAKARCLPD